MGKDESSEKTGKMVFAENRPIFKEQKNATIRIAQTPAERHHRIR
jgi:hypothetical protein